MSSTTPNLALTLYDSTTDQAVPFATFRAVWGGPATTSNFYKIDTGYGTLSTQIANLQLTKGAIRVSASYVSANYYEATGISSITAYTTNMTIALSVDTTSNGTVTLNINSLGTKSVMKVNSSGVATNLTGTDLTKGRLYLFMYDGTRWLWVSANTADQINIVGTVGNVVTVSSDNTLSGSVTPAALVGDATHAATSKGTPVDGDEIPISDSAATYAIKKVTFANLKTAIGSALGAIINALTSKSTPVDADIFVIGDSASSNASKKLSWSDLKTTLGTSFGAIINIATAKTTPVDADMFMIADSAASNASKKLTLGNLKPAIKSYTDSYYTANDGWIPLSSTFTYSSLDTGGLTGVVLVNADVTASIGVGDRISHTQSSVVKYGIVTAVGAYSAGSTPITFFYGQNTALANATITLPKYSHCKVPFGFPADASKWIMLVADTSDRSQSSPVQNQFYNLGSLSISVPIGAWKVGFLALGSASKATAQVSLQAALSTSTSSATDLRLLGYTIGYGESLVRNQFNVFNYITTSSKTSYYLIVKTGSVSVTDISLLGTASSTVLYAECSYF